MQTRVFQDSLGWRTDSGDHVVNHLAGDIGEAKISPGIAKGETLVIQAHEVEDGRVQVVHVHADGGSREAYRRDRYGPRRRPDWKDSDRQVARPALWRARS